MRRGTEIAMVFLILGLAAACTTFKPGCLVKEKASAALATVIVEQGECENSACVTAQHEKWFEAVGICKDQKTGAIADVICPIVVPVVVDQAVTFGFKTAYPGCGCKGVAAKEKLTPALTAVCKQIPVSAESR